MVGLLVVVVLTLAVWPSRIEDEVRDNADAAVANAGLEEVAFTISGRDLTVPAGTSDEAIEQLATATGVREVTVGPVRSSVVTDSADATADTTSPTQASAPLPTTGPADTVGRADGDPDDGGGRSPLTGPRTTDTSAPTETTAPDDGEEPGDEGPEAADPTLQELLAEALGTVEFTAADSAEPTADSKLRLDAVAELLTEHPEAVISVVGHVPAGTADAEALSLDRAWAVAGYLEWRGIGFERQMVSGAADTTPQAGLEPDDDQNARVELLVQDG